MWWCWVQMEGGCLLFLLIRGLVIWGVWWIMGWFFFVLAFLVIMVRFSFFIAVVLMIWCHFWLLRLKVILIQDMILIFRVIVFSFIFAPVRFWILSLRFFILLAEVEFLNRRTSFRFLHKLFEHISLLLPWATSSCYLRRHCILNRTNWCFSLIFRQRIKIQLFAKSYRVIDFVFFPFLMWSLRDVVHIIINFYFSILKIMVFFSQKKVIFLQF